MKAKVAACLLFFLNTMLFATYYSVSKEAIGRIDPIIFSFFEMVVLAPAGLCILIFSWDDLNREVVKRGVLLGSWLCLAFFTIAIALKYTSATSTAFFPSLNGLLAAFIAWVFLRQPVAKVTWVAGLISAIGTVLLISTSQMGGLRGTTIAFLGGLFFTCYVFLADHQQQSDIASWPLFGVELLTMALWAGLIVLLFGDWSAFHPSLPRDAWVILYIAGATTFLPTLITVLMQKYISPVTVSFIYILEPILGAVMATLYLGEVLPSPGYIGGGLVVAGAIVHTWGISRQSRKSATSRSAQRLVPMKSQHARSSFIGMIGYPALFLGAGFLLYSLSGFPPAPWIDLYRLWPDHSFLLQQGRGTYIFLLCTQAFCWLVAWISLVAMGLLTAYRLAHRIVFSRKMHQQSLISRRSRPKQQNQSTKQSQPGSPEQEIWETWRYLEPVSGVVEDRRGGGGADVGRGPSWPSVVLAVSPTLPNAAGHEGPLPAPRHSRPYGNDVPERKRVQDLLERRWRNRSQSLGA